MTQAMPAPTVAPEETAQQPLLDIWHLDKSFGGLAAVQDLHLQVYPGQIVSIIGPNGAGKTTVFNLITGLYKPNTTPNWVASLGARFAALVQRSPLRLLLWLISGGIGAALAPIVLGAINFIFQPLVQYEQQLGATPTTVIVCALGFLIGANSYYKRLANSGYWGNVAPRDPRILGHTGNIQLAGDSLVGLAPDGVLKRGVARTFQNIRLFNNMTVLENVMVGAHARLHADLFSSILRLPPMRREERRTRDRALELLGFFGPDLVARQNEFVLNLSYAEKRRVEIARALASAPRLLLLDEPTAGMNDAETAEAVKYIRALRDNLGMTILLIEHKLQVTMGLSDRIYVLDYGKKIAEGLPAEIQSNEQVIEAYLGRKAEV
ncbi:MAG TPA: ABC transporter ATP-binding protein [Ktedonobacterales bacterium]|jgi:ABC-type branched-subunit amino acid transport system ATPase component